MQKLLSAATAVLLLAAVLPAAAHPPFPEYRGLANASAAVRVGEDRFLAASDEDNALKLYAMDQPGDPLAVINTTPWLALRERRGEVDFEGAARIGDVAYWLGSHGRNKDGKARPDRQRLLATRIGTNAAGGVELTPVGPAMKTLLEQLVAAPTLARFHLGEAAKLAPEEPGGFNIEGLAGTPEDGLLIGLRSPVPAGKALLIPLLNPAELATGKPAHIGEPVTLDLDGLGVRDLLWTGREYFVLAGPSGGGGKSRLYRWAGGTAAPEQLHVPGLEHLNPEALVNFGTPEKPRLLILSDDGNRERNQTKDIRQRSFRALRFTP